MNSVIVKLVDKILKDNPEMDFLSALDEARSIYNNETEL